MAVKSDGTLWGWGENAWHALGSDASSFVWTPMLIGTASDWADVKARWGFSVALKRNGTLWGWGGLFPGKSWGPVPGQDDALPHQVGADSNWVAVAASDGSVLALKADGTLWAWGDNSYGVLGVGDQDDRITPTQVGSGGWAAVETSNYFTLALKTDGTLWGWGMGQTGSSKDSLQLTPRKLTTKRGWVAIASGSGHSLALQADRSLWAWGGNDFGQCGVGYKQTTIGFTQVGTAKDWQAIFAGGNASSGIRVNGEFYTWGYGYLGSNTYSTSTPIAIAAPDNWKMLDIGAANSFGVKNDGTLWAWGLNHIGQLGVGNLLDRLTPTRVGTGSSWIAVDAGSTHTLAIMADGTLWSWGENWLGELGRVVTKGGAYSTAPGKVAATGPWAAVSAGFGHTLALKADGTLWACGRNAEGQLGIGLDATSPTAHPRLVQVGSDSDWKQIAAGYSYSLAVKDDGTLWEWGQPFLSQVLAVPTRIGTDSDWASVGDGAAFSTALKTDGTLWVWGGSLESLGQPGLTSGLVPQELLKPAGKESLPWKAAATGVDYVMAVLSDGTLWGWGRIGDWLGVGDLPLGTPNDPVTYTYPIQVGTDEYCWKAVAASPFHQGQSPPHTLGLKCDSTLRAWGYNIFGQLGNGSSAVLLVPTRLVF